MANDYDNHERIWLEPVEPVDPIEGRQWCRDNVWGNGVEYVRADLVPAPQEQTMGSALTDLLQRAKRMCFRVTDEQVPLFSSNRLKTLHRDCGTLLQDINEYLSNPAPQDAGPLAYASEWTAAQLRAGYDGDYRLTVSAGQVALFPPPGSHLRGDADEQAAINLGAAVLSKIEDPAAREVAIRNALTMAAAMNVRGDLYDADVFMADGGDTVMTAAEAVLAWLLIEKIGVPDDVGYSPNQAQEIIVRRLDLARELEEIDSMLAEGQGDDEGHPIMPEFTKGMTTYAKVEACLHLLERRRDALHSDAARAVPANADAENERFREALETIADIDMKPFRCAAIARAALTTEGQP